MPIYEYACESCAKVTEEMQKFSDAPLTDCPACGAKGTLRKIMSRTSFALKGTGWYTTDYKRASAPAKDGAKDAAAAEKPAPEANPAGETKPASEAKPAATPKTGSGSSEA